ncbi:MAG: 50S ribosomal protein L23 [Candidatus Entotheonella gemina]|uniref:Large ribosomal subunit protein uL23 n=1 Tax=Candidatus Entotheonella gemina TaxID=1429439 RepID=W4MH32_9BACT|nr:MAG: 50S ribosomal protein L23 [Candidatus Entotheonella gemina]
MEPYQIIKQPLITEKGMRLNEEGSTVVFRVDSRANKLQIKHAVEVLFNVKVLKVNTLNVEGKKRRIRYREGKRPDWKKAYVTLRDGDSITFFEGV